MSVICRHCLKERKAIYRRGLCITCHRTPEVRMLYPPRAMSLHLEDAGEKPPLEPAREPTEALPGTEAKVAELERRAAARQELWHRQDARYSTR